jgi:hypothetical protein
MRRLHVCGRLAQRVLLALGLLGTQGVGAIGVERVFAQQSGSNANFELCRAITDDATRLRCFASATRGHATNSVSRSLGPNAGAWRLVRTPNPAGGPDAVSIMQTADTAKSDLDLAGLALRCRDGGVEVLVVLVSALSARAHPKVVITAPGTKMDFIATIAPPGASLLLPSAASDLASGPWTAVGELDVRIETEQTDGTPSLVRGVIPVTGLREALSSLRASCPSQ